MQNLKADMVKSEDCETISVFSYHNDTRINFLHIICRIYAYLNVKTSVENKASQWIGQHWTGQYSY